MTRTHKMIMCHSAKLAAASYNRCHGTRRACCRARCLLLSRTSDTRFADSIFTVHDPFLGEAVWTVDQSFSTLPTLLPVRNDESTVAAWHQQRPGELSIGNSGCLRRQKRSPTCCHLQARGRGHRSGIRPFYEQHARGSKLSGEPPLYYTPEQGCAPVLP